MSTSRARQYWPECWLDESMPAGRAEPSGFIVETPDGLTIGYAAGAGDASDDERRVYRIGVGEGDIVKFRFCDDVGELDVTFNADGTYSAAGPVPAHNWCRLGFDQDTLQQSLDALAKAIAGTSDELDRIDLDGQPTQTVEFAYWSDPLPHKLTKTAAGWRFEPVSASEARQ